LNGAPRTDYGPGRVAFGARLSTEARLERLLHQGLAAQQRGDQAEAERCYLAILALAPHEPNANHLLGVLRFQQGHAAEAEALIGKALAQVPQSAELNAHYGLVLHGLGRDQDALTALDAALALAPDQAEVLNSRAMVLQALHRPHDALSSAQKALSLEPGYAEAWNNHAVALRALGRLDEALASFDRGGSLDPHNLQLQFNRGLVCRDLGQCRLAIDAFQTVLKQAPEHAESLHNLALAQCEAGDTEAAMVSFRRHAALVSAGAGPAPDFKRRHDEEQKAYIAANPSSAEAAARRAGPAINPDQDTAGIAKQWKDARPQLVVIDNLLTQPALEALRRFCWQEPVWNKIYDNGYLGALPERGFAAPLLAQIADELRQTYGVIFGTHALRYLWAFKCDSHLKGVNIHADFAAVNVNFWITPDEANRDRDSGGLIIWDKAAPLDWDFPRYNNDEAAIRVFLKETGARSQTVPYRANRAVIFDSDLFHQTDDIDFRDGYAHRRINITMLFGRRRSHEGLAQTGKSGS
jgi:tetratricopeptide (TPR) repeat protein